MLQYVDTMTTAQADAINDAITAFIVACALPFAIVANIFFINLLRTLRPAFIAQNKLKSRTWFSREGLKRLYEKVWGQVQDLFNLVAAHAYMTLAGDGFKTESGHKVVNFTEQAAGKVAFKTSKSVSLERENDAFYVEAFKEQIATRDLSSWCSCVGDNVQYMRNAFNTLSELYPTILFYGCVAHLLDLLCEDYAKLLGDIVNEVKKVVLFVVSHSRVKELFAITKGPSGIGLRTFPDTRFSYAALMHDSVL